MKTHWLAEKLLAEPDKHIELFEQSSGEAIQIMEADLHITDEIVQIEFDISG